MKKILLTSVFATMMILPVFAVDNGDSCDENTLQTTGGTVELRGTWTENTINLNWYDGDNIFHSNTCNYGGNIDLPETNPVKTGYKFVKWQKAPPQCKVSMLPSGSFGSEDNGYINQDGSSSNADEYGLTENSTWASPLQEYDATQEIYGPVLGVMRGISYCSAKSGDNQNWKWNKNTDDWTATYDELTSATGTAKYCWCHGTTYTPTNGEQCRVLSTARWVFIRDIGSVPNCVSRCARSCTTYISSKETVRVALFGQSN